jgi:hypothetical protein
MTKMLRICAALAAVALCVSLAPVAEAGTIIKLSLGSDALPDVDFDGTVFSTIDDGVAGTLGDQNTAVEFLDFLAFITPIPTADASYSLSGVTVSGSATVLMPFNIVVQSFTGGSFSLYDDSNVLLLSANLGASTLTGPVGPPATGALFNTTLGSVTGGTLATLIDPNSISLSIGMTDIDGGSGFSITTTPGGNVLDPFAADVTESIAADQQAIPEPAAAMLILLGGVLMMTRVRRGRC